MGFVVFFLYCFSYFVVVENLLKKKNGLDENAKPPTGRAGKVLFEKKKGFGERSEVLVDGEQEEQIVKRWKALVGYIHRKPNSRLVVQLWIQRQ